MQPKISVIVNVIVNMGFWVLVGRNVDFVLRVMKFLKLQTLLLSD